ncbi:Exosome complex exonuclease RRP6 [Smittium mucronatum]|uniref:Exosome complex exonuclease RRP6 n=1 Tax=Smittium mucronatum TaxID=133383 RepID=A0A1R0GSM5_9FUNG|nr:Exosome complex exonuclease RRP6 [Smittium mucronatum]
MMDNLISLPTTDGQGDLAIDLEHHDRHSYYGFTCLVQISTHQMDYVVDTLRVRSEMYKLNLVTTDPIRIKVMHGSQNDIAWLQKDFGVYVVGLFDTAEASHICGFKKNSLKTLLSYFCNYQTNKKYQLADWRMRQVFSFVFSKFITLFSNKNIFINRPLSTEMLEYAISDTHFLLYIADRLKNILMGYVEPPGEDSFEKVKERRLSPNAESKPEEKFKGDKSQLDRACKNSSKISLVQYTRKPYFPQFEFKLSPDSSVDKYNPSVSAVDNDEHKINSNPNLNQNTQSFLNSRRKYFTTPEKLETFELLMAWRDYYARLCDVSVFYVCSNKDLFDLAMGSINCREDIENTLKRVSYIIEENIDSLLTVLSKRPVLGESDKVPCDD